jgi:tight adherence protein B
MTEVVAALAALGVLFVFEGFAGPPSPRRWSIVARLDSFVEEAGVRSMTGLRLVAACTACGLMAFLATAGISSSIVVAGAVAVGAVGIPPALVGAQRQRRRRSFRDAWPDAIATLIAGVRAGVSLPEACSALSDRGPDDLRSGFAAFGSSYRATGSFNAGLERIRDEFADPVADRVVAALALARDVGGNDLVRVLRTLSDFVREDARVRREIEARWSWTVVAARVAAAAPWVVLLLMSTRPEAAAAYNTPAGATAIGIGAGATIVGYRLMLRAGRLTEERRLA